METVLAVFTIPLFELIAWALIHFLWQGVLVALVLGGALYLLRHQHASIRYGLACGAMLLMVLLPVVTTVYLADRPEATNSTRGSIPGPVEVGVGGSHATEVAPFPANATPVSAVSIRSFLPSLDKLFPWIVLCWFGGVCALSLLHLSGWRRIQRLKVCAAEPVTAIWQQRARRIGRQLRLRHAVRILQSTLVEVPTVIGWLSPVVLVPVSTFSGLSPAQLEAILIHELAHVRRRDYLINLLQIVAETLLFYHPAVWWVSRVIRHERELCCDDIAVELSGNRLEYARALLGLEELRLAHPQFVVTLSGGSLTQRIRRLVGGHTMPHSYPSRPHLAGILFVTLFLLGGRSLRPGGGAERQPWRRGTGIVHGRFQPLPGRW